jgi:hypothetical protein
MPDGTGKFMILVFQCGIIEDSYTAHSLSYQKFAA